MQQARKAGQQSGTFPLKTSQSTSATEFSTALRTELGKTDERLLSVIPVSWRSGHPQSYPPQRVIHPLEIFCVHFSVLIFFPLFRAFLLHQDWNTKWVLFSSAVCISYEPRVVGTLLLLVHCQDSTNSCTEIL